MTLPLIRDAIIADLKTRGLGDAVESHPGRLSAEDLKSFAAKGRTSIRVAILGIPAVEKAADGEDLDVAWAAYILAFDVPGVTRDAAAAYLVATVCRAVAGNVWGRTDLDSPKQIRADNLYTGTLDKRAVALWAVTWRQVWTPETPEDPASLDDLIRVVVDYDINPEQESEPAARDVVELAGGSVL